MNMAIYLTESDVERLLTMPEAVAALEGAFARQAQGATINQPRRRLYLPRGAYHTMTAADMEMGFFGIKAYASFSPKTRFLVLLYSVQNGDLLAMIEADRLGQMRTGAASGVATHYLARQRGTLGVGIYGTGWQAQAQLQAICAVREIKSIVAYSRDAARRAEFCARMSAELSVEVVPAEQPQQAAEGQDVIITATSAREPVLHGQWIAPGAHLNIVGSNMLMKREIDDDTVQRSDLIVVDSIEQSKVESGDLLAPFERRLFHWEQVAELADVVGGKHPGRMHDSDITLFKSNGIAMEDIAVAAVVYQKARSENVGAQIPMWQ
jgi:alanine dehydrogenase